MKVNLSRKLVLSLILICINLKISGQNTIKYRPDEQFYEIGKGVNILKPYVNCRQFLVNKTVESTSPITTSITIKVVQSEEELYSILNISNNINFDYNFFKLDDKTFSSRSIYSKKNSLRIIIYAKRVYGKSSLSNDDDSNLQIEAKKKIENKDFTAFLNNYGNYYVSAIEKTQVSAISLDFKNVDSEEKKQFTEDFGSSVSYLGYSVSGGNSLSNFIEKKLKESNLNIQIFDFNKYNFTKDDETAKILLSITSGKEILNNISDLLEKKIKTFTFENAAPSTFYLSPMSNFDIPSNLIPDILEARLDDEKNILYNLFSSLDILNEIKDSKFFKSFPDNSVINESTRLKNVLQLLQKSLSTQTKNLLTKKKNDSDSPVFDLNRDLIYPKYTDSLFYKPIYLSTKENYLAYTEYVKNIVDFFIDKYTDSPFSRLDFSANYDINKPIALTIGKSIEVRIKEKEFYKELLTISNDTAIIFYNQENYFDLSKQDLLFKTKLNMRYFDPPGYHGFPKFKIEAIVGDSYDMTAISGYMNGVPIYGVSTAIVLPISTTRYSDITDGLSPYLKDVPLEETYSFLNSISDELSYKNYYFRQHIRGFRLTYLGHHLPVQVNEDKQIELDSSTMPILIWKYQIKME